MFCSSSEIVRIWNFHAINNLKPTKCTPGILGFEEFELKDYLHDYLKSNPDKVFCKQFTEIHKLFTNGVPDYGGKHRLFDVILRAVINQGLAIPIKSIWTNLKNFDFHYYCESIFWPTVCQSIHKFSDNKSNSKYPARLASARAHRCNNCKKKFGSLRASQDHAKNVHQTVPKIDFEVESDSIQSDSEDTKWIAIQCQKCNTLLMTEANVKNHEKFHQTSDKKTIPGLIFYADTMKDKHYNPSFETSSSDSEPELYEEPVSNFNILTKISPTPEKIINVANPNVVKIDKEEGSDFYPETLEEFLKINPQYASSICQVEMSQCSFCDKPFRTETECINHIKKDHKAEVQKKEKLEIQQKVQELVEKSIRRKERQKRKKQAKKAKKCQKSETQITESVKQSVESLPNVQNESKFSKSEKFEKKEIHENIELTVSQNSAEPPEVEESIVQVLEHANEVIDVPEVEGATGISGSSTDISKYIDSLELEIRCLKVSQQFFATTKEENSNLKKELKSLREISTIEKLKNESVEQENCKLRQELHNLKESTDESQKCKICMEGKLEIAFIPCGHIFTCTNCAPSCKNCPLCRKPAKHLKIYLP